MHQTQPWLLKWLHFVGLAGALCQHSMVLAATTDFLGHIKGYCCPYQCATAATSVHDTFPGLCQLCHESFPGKFHFSELSLPPISLYCCLWFLGIMVIYALYSILSDLINACTHQFKDADRYENFFSRVIVVFLLLQGCLFSYSYC